jgi:hypothetical protein
MNIAMHVLFTPEAADWVGRITLGALTLTLVTGYILKGDLKRFFASKPSQMSEQARAAHH